MLQKWSREALRPYDYFSHVITITSQTGVGSSSTLKGLREAFADDSRMRFVSGGQIMRVVAASLGMTIEEFAAYNKAHPEAGHDKRCDDEIRAYGSQNHTVVESRLAHVFVPRGFHVRLICPAAIRAERRARDQRTTVALELQKIHERDDNDESRYAQLYPGSLWIDEDFDLVLNTSVLSTPAIVFAITETHDVWRRNRAGRIRYTITGA